MAPAASMADRAPGSITPLIDRSANSAATPAAPSGGGYLKAMNDVLGGAGAGNDDLAGQTWLRLADLDDIGKPRRYRQRR